MDAIWLTPDAEQMDADEATPILDPATVRGTDVRDTPRPLPTDLRPEDLPDPDKLQPAGERHRLVLPSPIPIVFPVGKVLYSTTETLSATNNPLRLGIPPERIGNLGVYCIIRNCGATGEASFSGDRAAGPLSRFTLEVGAWSFLPSVAELFAWIRTGTPTVTMMVVGTQAG